MLHHTSHLLYTELALNLNFIHFIFKYLYNLSPISITDVHTPYEPAHSSWQSLPNYIEFCIHFLLTRGN